MADDDRALAEFISSWLAKRGLEMMPIGTDTRPEAGSVPPQVDAGMAPPGQVDPPATIGAPRPQERGGVRAGTYVNPTTGPGSSLAYPAPGSPLSSPAPDPWIDPLPHLSFGPLDIDTGRRSVRVLGDEVHLTPTEFRLLCYLVEHSDRVVGHRELLLSVWGPGYGDDIHLLQVTIRSLRARIAQVRECPLIESVYGTGYRMASRPEPASPPVPRHTVSARRT